MSILALSGNSLSRFQQPRFTNYHWIVVAIAILFVILAGIYVGYQNSQPNFTFGNNGDSMLRHGLSYQQSIAAANKVGLPIYRKDIGGQRVLISYEEARKLESQTDRSRISVPVYPGERFDLRFGTHFYPDPRKPALDKR